MIYENRWKDREQIHRVDLDECREWRCACKWYQIFHLIKKKILDDKNVFLGGKF